MATVGAYTAVQWPATRERCFDACVAAATLGEGDAFVIAFCVEEGCFGISVEMFGDELDCKVAFAGDLSENVKKYFWRESGEWCICCCRHRISSCH